MQLNSRIIILVKAPGSTVKYVTFFLKQYFLCNVMCICFQTASRVKMKLTTILVLKIRLEILYF